MSIMSPYHGASVLVTGHTGFKGSWMCLLLKALGARVTGLALPPPTHPNLFEIADVASQIAASHVVDVRDMAALQRHIENAAPDVVFHMAAQPLVLESYRDPVGTFSTNIMGTVHVLEALKSLKKPAAAVMITSDKCYKNYESETPYDEASPLGGSDPYTASKACAEIVSHAYRSAFFSTGQVRVATARAGNVLGGGDFGEHRLIPDLYRCAVGKTPIRLRYPDAVRPWQYILDVLWGYLLLGAALRSGQRDAEDSFNFAPVGATPVTVRDIVERFCLVWQRNIPLEYEAPKHPETGMLRINARKAEQLLGWRSRMDTDAMLTATAEWYAAYLSGTANMLHFTETQLQRYVQADRALRATG